MSVNFDPNLPSNLDWVRSLIGDTDESNGILQDETIEAILEEEHNNKYLAAYTAGMMVIAVAQKGGLSSKSVEDFAVAFGAGGAEGSGYRSHLESLLIRGNQVLAGGQAVFKLSRYRRGDL